MGGMDGQAGVSRWKLIEPEDEVRNLLRVASTINSLAMESSPEGVMLPFVMAESLFSPILDPVYFLTVVCR